MSGGGKVGSGGGKSCWTGEGGDALDEWNEEVDEDGDKGISGD